jgi:hypothetical protein
VIDSFGEDEAMNRIVREHYPVADLPDDLRMGLPADANVRVTIEPETSGTDKVLSLDELFALRTPPFRSTEDVVADIRRLRDEWND